MKRKVSIEQSLSLNHEVGVVEARIQHGMQILTNYRSYEESAEPVMSQLSIGAEKLLKLTLGLHALHTDSRWFDKKAISAHRHDIVQFDAAVRDIVNRIQAEKQNEYIKEVVDRVDRNPYLPQILVLLTDYAEQGRYYNLDLIANGQGRATSPHKLWDRLERAIFENEPDLLRAHADGETDAASRYTSRIYHAFGVWLEYIARLWRFGLFGAIARQYAPRLDLHNILGNPRVT